MRPLSAEPGHVRMEFTASEQFLNPAGVVQGGFITAMLDDTMGPAAVAQLGPGHFAPTLELKVSFLRPVGARAASCADGRVVHMGKSVAFLEGSLADEEGNLVATATATARVVKLGAARRDNRRRARARDGGAAVARAPGRAGRPARPRARS